ncbi:hypothetical protein O181_122206 [Austropuccinia psidii MF-1]|uniref:Uncharacterized protein n=1 Tax=Austropuccinia psidii MF-1 TaxID=1389203 RepID=A0A9Q3KLU4_9BASI|nr:hypothetical protein [Austropuccinia psidii MF-1]
MTFPACSSRVLIVRQPHALICTPRRVIHRQLLNAWKTFYFQSSNRLFSWLGGQLDCRCSPAWAWKPEANQGGFASARPMIAELWRLACCQKMPWAGGLFCWSFIHAGGKDSDANLRGLVPTSNAIGLNVYVAHDSRPVPPLIMPQIPPWKPSRRQSAKHLMENQRHVWWHATKNISPTHTQTSPQ